MPIRHKPPQFDPETLALRVLAHIAMDETLMPRFLTLSGLDIETLKARGASFCTISALDWWRNGIAPRPVNLCCDLPILRFARAARWKGRCP